MLLWPVHLVWFGPQSSFELCHLSSPGQSFGTSHYPIRRLSCQSSCTGRSRCMFVSLGRPCMALPDLSLEFVLKITSSFGPYPWLCEQGNTLLHEIFGIELEKEREKVLLIKYSGVW
jgi:hypothetical protein